MRKLLDPASRIECSIAPTAAAAPAVATTTAAAAVAAATTTTTATTVAATATATAAPTFLPWLGFVDRQPPPVMLVVIECRNRRLRFGVGSHLHEAEPLGSVCVPIDDDLCALDRARTA